MHAHSRAVDSDSECYPQTPIEVAYKQLIDAIPLLHALLWCVIDAPFVASKTWSRTPHMKTPGTERSTPKEFQEAGWSKL